MATRFALMYWPRTMLLTVTPPLGEPTSDLEEPSRVFMGGLGVYLSPPLKAGKYTLVGSAKGFETGRVEVDIDGKPGEPVMVILKLKVLESSPRLPTPQNLRVEVISGRRVISVDPVPGAVRYRFQRKGAGGPVEPLTPSFVETGLNAGQSDEYSAVAVGANPAQDSLPVVKTLTMPAITPPVTDPNPPVVVVPGQWVDLPQVSNLATVCGPMRGLSKLDRALTDAYDAYAFEGYRHYEHQERENLSDLCPAPGVFNFSRVEAKAKACGARGQKFILGVTLFNPYEKEKERPDAWPSYLKRNPETRDPLWRDPLFIQLQKEFPGRLVADARAKGYLKFLAAVDIRVDGDYGEGRDFQATTEELARPDCEAIIDAWINAFRGTGVFLLSMTDQREDLYYAINRTLDNPGMLGMRRESFGDPTFNGFKLSDEPPAVQQRPLLAPFMVESFGSWNHDWSVIERQVRENKISCIKDQNHGTKWADMTPTVREQWLRAELASGYRLTARRVIRPASVTAGEGLTVRLEWANSANNVAPLFVDMRPELVLRDNTGREVASPRVSFDLRTLRPGEAANSTTTIPTTGLARGSYGLFLRVVDPNGVYKPMELALAGKGNDNTYPLGTVLLS